MKVKKYLVSISVVIEGENLKDEDVVFEKPIPSNLKFRVLEHQTDNLEEFEGDD